MSDRGPIIVGIDTATDDAAVAIARASEPLAERLVAPREGGRPRHAEGLLAAVEELVAEAGGWAAVDRIAIGTGPGSFTGLRIGVATARALAQAGGIEIAPVGSLAALADSIARRPDAGGRTVAALIDARRGEAFLALRSADGAVSRPRVAGPDELVEVLREADPPALAAGSGALRFREPIAAAGIEVLADGEPQHRMSAAAICRLGALADPLPIDAIRPTYLRRPDAELWRERDRDRREARGGG